MEIYSNEYKVKDYDSIYHIVKEGESLCDIADKYKVSVDDLKKINNLSNYKVESGKKLKIK
ncbi:MAG: LysM peptidoglycan-binding domain-containing protein [Ignavibacteriales bacterium]|nr:LysM peptidoglycan-binding domain-containing protein [Ignavibacteriales bacterium]